MSHQNGSSPRNYLAEAHDLLRRPEATRVPQREHLAALQTEINRLVAIAALQNRALIGILLELKQERAVLPADLIARIEAVGLDLVVQRAPGGPLTVALLRPTSTH